jgi:hypothetical protein
LIIFKGVLCGIGLSVLGTIAYIVLLWCWWYRRARLLYPTGAIGFDISSLGHNTYLAPAYWCFVLGLMLTGIAIVALWPRAAPPPH